MEYKFNKAAGALQEASSEGALNVAPRRRASLASVPAAYAASNSLVPTDARSPHDAMRDDETRALARLAAPTQINSVDPTRTLGGPGMFFYTVEEGQHVLVVHPKGTVEEIVGPARVWTGRKRFRPMVHHVAHPGEFLSVRFRDGRQEHHPGPAHVWFDPRKHLAVTKDDALQISAREAVVVYARGTDGTVERRIEQGPSMFVPAPGEWLHTFSWHGSSGGAEEGYRKVPNGLVFQKLWLLPDQMYHDVTDVRTADDALLTLRLMIFFELVDIDTMLASTHDPIGDFVNAATSDVVDFTGRHDFESFKRHTEALNDLATYRQLVARAVQCGYRISKVVYRGYGAPETLQQMHDQAIESRTRLQLERATQQQAQELEDFNLERAIARGSRQREDSTAAAEHEIAIARKQQLAELASGADRVAFHREQRKLDAETELASKRERDAHHQTHLTALRELGVDLTALLTQARADRVIELRGGSGGTGVAGAHIHLNEDGSPRRDGGAKV